MELREPPRETRPAPPDRLVRALLVAQLVLVAAAAGWVLFGPRGEAPRPGSVERLRQVGARLEAAGAHDEAAALYADYLATARLEPAERAGIAYSLGLGFLERGRYERALRWFYEAEAADGGELGAELASKIVHTLERLGRHHAAQAVLERGTEPLSDPSRRPESDPVVATIGERRIHRSDLDLALDGLPPEVARQFDGAAGRREFLRRYVADELLWRKASKLEFDDDPEVRRQHALLLRQLAVSRFVEREVAERIEVSPTDLENFYAAHRERWAVAGADGGEPRTPPLEEIRPVVERDYRGVKMQEAYERLVDSELAAEEVELFPERLGDGG